MSQSMRVMRKIFLNREEFYELCIYLHRVHVRSKKRKSMCYCVNEVDKM